MKTIKLLILLMVATLSMQSCRKDSDIIDITPIEEQTGFKVEGSVMGTVVDENGLAVADALVTYADLTERTDQYGVFRFDDETFYSEGTYIQVEKDGYFKGSRKFYPVSGATSRVHVELMQMVQVASFSSSAGEKVQFEGVEIAFGNNSIMKEDGSDYSGNVKVFAKYLDPTLLATLNQMPGDLTAMNASDERVALTSYGMVTVELRDDSGNELQVKDGSSAEMSMPVPADILANAPQTIPLWHFDENRGTWVEDGEATLTNGAYVGQVSHFSFWNCDVPSELIHLSGTVFNRGVPVQGVLVKISLASDNASGSGFTNAEGQFGGFVPKGEVLLVEVFDHCGVLMHTTTIGPFDEDTTLDPFYLTISALQAIVSGSVTSCDGEPSGATYVVVVQDDFNYIVNISDDNTFQTNVFYCEEGAEITVGAKDPINQLASANSIFTIEGNIDVGVLELCEESISPIVILEYGDIMYSSESSGLPDSFLVVSYTIETLSLPGEPTKDKYTVSYLDWNWNTYFEFELIYEEGVPSQNAKVVNTDSAGFIARGESTVQLVEQGGKIYITANGVLDEIEITDATKYDPSYDPCTFYIAFEKL